MGCVYCKIFNGASLGIKRLHPKAQLPFKRVEDSGYDVYGIFEDKSYILLKVGDNAIIRTGIAMQIPQGLGFEIKNRSSNGILGAVVGAELVDSGYRGEVHIDIHNISNKLMFITDLTLEELQDRAEEISKKYFNGDYSAGHMIEQYLQKDKIKLIDQNNALIQGVITPTLHLPVIEKETLDKSVRADGKFGSTNKVRCSND